jgi:thiol-disulfide isomerase/thioredoxin
MAFRRREVLILGAAGLAAAAAGAMVGAFVLQTRSGAAELLAAPFRDLEGRERRLIDWKGRALLCNFWATWCPPCLEEVPLLVAAKRKLPPGGPEIVGIGIDNEDKIREFAAKFKINYPVLVAGATALDLLRRLGNSAGALPFTVLLDPSGALAHRQLGALTSADLDRLMTGIRH